MLWLAYGLCFHFYCDLLNNVSIRYSRGSSLLAMDYVSISTMTC